MIRWLNRRYCSFPPWKAICGPLAGGRGVGVGVIPGEGYGSGTNNEISGPGSVASDSGGSVPESVHVISTANIGSKSRIASRDFRPVQDVSNRSPMRNPGDVTDPLT